MIRFEALRIPIEDCVVDLAKSTAPCSELEVCEKTWMGHGNCAAVQTSPS
jgi:hypothetical protein